MRVTYAAQQRGVRASLTFSLVHHSDRGVQYACADYTRMLDEHRILASMSRPGNPYDNAKAESFMKTLKQEEVDGSDYRDSQQARKAIGTFLETVYNRQRLHSALDYRPPAEFEAQYARAVALSNSHGPRLFKPVPELLVST